jgi:maltose alpha-D-glucosyltransferase/alpha-amylase
LVGEFVGVPSSQFSLLAGTADTRQPIRCGSSDQSNSAVVFGSQLFLKVFRKLEAGLNPDHEIAQFLTNRTSFTRLPRVAGAIEYRTPGGEAITLAVLQAWVPNQGNAWEAMLADLKRVLAGGDFHEDDLIRLGQRTAEMHNALASCMDLAEFSPEAMTSHDIDRLVARLQHRAKKILTSVEELLQSDTTKSKAVNRDKLTQLLKLAPAIDEVAERIKNSPLAAKTRVHGDYHLGQVLCQDHDFIILDFEGEPARPLAERRAKDCPLRDVAGMIRSFSYAAHVGLLDYAKPQAPTPEQKQIAVEWRRKCEEFFWRSYLQTAADAIFLPADEQATRTLLDFYIVEKALYELGYEVNNRPDWVEIPLVGILELLSPKS